MLWKAVKNEFGLCDASFIREKLDLVGKILE